MVWKLLTVIGVLAAGAASASAGLIAADSFTYAVGDLNGNSGGTGWTPGSTWSAIPQLDVVAVSLSYSNGAVTVSGGNRAVQVGYSSGVVDGIMSRQFPTQSGTLYFSLLIRAATGLSDDDFMHWILNDDTDHDNAGSIGFRNAASNENGLFARVRSTSDTSAKSNIKVVAGTTYLLVGKFYKSGASGTRYDTMALYVNPSTLTEPVTASATAVRDSGSSSLSYLTLRIANLDDGDQYQFDELRIGTTYADVVPEPATLALLAIGASALFLRRRR